MGKTREEMASLINISAKTIQNYEEGKHLPNEAKQKEIIGKIKSLLSTDSIAQEPSENYAELEKEVKFLRGLVATLQSVIDSYTKK